LGDDVALIDPALMQAERAANLLGEFAHGTGQSSYVTSGDEAAFHANVSRLMRAVIRASRRGPSRPSESAP
jgi:hypothetical protein